MSRPYIHFGPVIQEEDGDLIVVSPGASVLEAGEAVDLFEGPTRREYRDRIVVAVDSFRINDMPEGMLDLVGQRSAADFLRHLSGAHKTMFPADVMVTVYRLTSPPQTDEDA